MCAAVVVVSSLDQTFQDASSSSSQLSFSPLVLSFYVSFRTRDDVIKTIDCRSHDLLHRAPYSNKKKEKERKKKTRLALSLPCGFFSSFFFFFFFLSFFLLSFLPTTICLKFHSPGDHYNCLTRAHVSTRRETAQLARSRSRNTNRASPDDATLLTLDVRFSPARRNCQTVAPPPLLCRV